MITKNVGNADRVIRIIAALALGFGAYKTAGPAMYILAVAAVGALATGLVGWCGLYTLLGINTCKIDKP
jgi:hypothetical protein